MRVLYVEDLESDADLACKVLAQTAPGIELEHAWNARDALGLLQGGRDYDLLLSDLQLPGRSGLDLLAQVRERRLPLAVVLLTGAGDAASALAALRAGADDYLVKEGDYLKRLPDTLTRALQRYRREGSSKPRPLRALYAEPDPQAMEAAIRHLAEAAPQISLHAVQDAAQLRRGLSRKPAEGQGYDLVLVEASLLGPLDEGLLDELRLGCEPRTPFVLVTSRGNEQLISAALRLGVAEVVIKQDDYLLGLPAVLEKAHLHAEQARQLSALQSANSRLQHILAANPTVLYCLRTLGGRLRPDWVSENVASVLGYPVEEVLRPDWWARKVHPEDRQATLARLAGLGTGGHLTQEYRLLAGDGSYRWIRDQVRPLEPGGGEAGSFVGSWNDVTRRRQILEQHRLNSAVIDNTRDGVLVTDLQGRVLSVNRAFTETTGYEEAQILGRNPRLLQSGRHDADFYAEMWRQLTGSGRWSGELWNRRRNGEIYPTALSLQCVYDESGLPTHYVGISTDISRLKRSEKQLERIAHYDPLTDLPNRLLVQSRLDYLLDRAHQANTRLAVLFINLDRFKTVNDSLGHTTGDELLAAVARRIGAALGEGADLGRVGGDEFVVLLERIELSNQAAATAQTVLDSLTEPFQLRDGPEIYVSASIGISIYPEDAEEASELIRDADSAMHSSKARGRNGYRFYTERLTQAARARLDLESRLRGALERQEFVLHYQPLVSVADNRVQGVEALLRWQTGDGELIAPDRFIPLAEETGAILPLGAWVLRSACRQVQAWRQAGHPLRTLSVNLSVRQLQDAGMLATVAEALESSGLPPGALELELTESMLMAEGDRAAKRLLDLKALGVRLAIDDFGTGYSSLAYLSRLPFDTLKVDRSFIGDVPASAGAVEITSTIIAMARGLHLQVLAEGVETEQQLAFLRERGCDAYQGYLFSRPLAANALADLLMPDD